MTDITKLTPETKPVPFDPADIVARSVLLEYFEDGRLLKRCLDGDFSEYKDTHWVNIKKSKLRHLLQKTARYLFPKDKLATLVNQALVCLDDHLSGDEHALNISDNAPPVINVENGELWIGDNGIVKLRPHQPESGLTHCLPITYDPNAKCPRYDQALLEVFGQAADRDGLIRHFNEFVGYAIQPSRDIACFWLLIGPGANGKTSLLNTLQKLVGQDAVMNDSMKRFLRDRFNTAYLQNKLLFIDDDLAENLVMDDGLLKKISEQKQISARRAYGRHKVSFTCRALPVMAGNSYPFTGDISRGMSRRAQVIPFKKTFSELEQDPTLFPGIWNDEMPGVLNRALEGIKRLRQRGGQFDPPVDCQQAEADFFAHANPLVAFIEAQCIKNPDGRLRLMDMRAAIKEWVMEQGIKRPDCADTTLKRKLTGLGHKISKIKGYRTVHGLRLKPLE